MKYELVEAKDLKEGKKAYKKTDKLLTDMPMDAFIEQFISDFDDYLQVEKKVEMAEEHFHKGQIALFATVVSVSTPIEDNNNVKHSLTQVTSSDNK